jgi:hypothetical protein
MRPRKLPNTYRLCGKYFQSDGALGVTLEDLCRPIGQALLELRVILGHP